MVLTNKGQGAMEYLMTYGWAILGDMVFGIVMWQLGIFNMGGTTLTSTGFAKIKPQLAGTGVSESGVVAAVFTNGAGAAIEFTDGSADIGGVIADLGADGAVGTTIAAGGNFEVTGSADFGGIAGDVYAADITLAYDINVGGITTSHVESGSLRGPYEA